MLTRGKTYLHNPEGTGSSIQIDDLDEDNVVVSL